MDFDFSVPEDRALRDWDLLRSREQIAWTEKPTFASGDTLVYNGSAWSNSDVSLDIAPGQTGKITLLYPLNGPENYMATTLDLRPMDYSVQVLRRHKGEQHAIGRSSAVYETANRTELTVRSVGGLFVVFVNNTRLIETNEYDLTEGTVGIRVEEATNQFPVERLHVRRVNLLLDRFPILDGENLGAIWEISRGSWKVAPSFTAKSRNNDGQLLAMGEGLVLLGQDSWEAYNVEISAFFEEATRVAVIGWAKDDTFLEFYCERDTAEIRKSVGGDRVSLVSCSLQGSSTGWHRLAFALHDNEVTAQIDGEEVLRWGPVLSSGRAGIFNYGDYAIFDDLAVQVTSIAKENVDIRVETDPVLLEIEDILLK